MLTAHVWGTVKFSITPTAVDKSHGFQRYLHPAPSGYESEWTQQAPLEMFVN